MKSGINYSIIIPNYNGSKFLPDVLNSIISAVKKSDNQFEVILVDNGSKDNSIAIFKDLFSHHPLPNLTSDICQLKSNHGFASAVNLGIQKAKYEYVVLLNNDITFNSDWFNIISQNIKDFDQPKLAVITGTVLNKTGTHFESQGLDYYYIGKCQNVSNNLPFLRSNIYNLTSGFIWGASAAFSVYRKSIITQIGMFDDQFFAYEEDVDLALRLHNLGYKTLYIPQAISYHLGGGTSSKMGNFRSRHDFKNWIYIIIKNYSAADFWQNFPQIIIERFRNLSGFVKNTIISYGSKSIYILPKDLLATLAQIIFTLPSMIQKRHKIKHLLKFT